MPVRLNSRLASESDARIEIVPLIDIMFFLLASFMLVSLSMIDARTMSVKLPGAAHGARESKQGDTIFVTVDKNGTTYFEDAPLGLRELSTSLAASLATRPGLKVLINGDKDARHGDIVRVLDAVRGAGVQNVAFSIGPENREGIAP